MNKGTLRPVIVTDKGKRLKGYFHRFVYKLANHQSETHVLVELEDGNLRYYDPYFVQFSDRKNCKEESQTKTKPNTSA